MNAVKIASNPQIVATTVTTFTTFITIIFFKNIAGSNLPAIFFVRLKVYLLRRDLLGLELNQVPNDLTLVDLDKM